MTTALPRVEPASAGTDVPAVRATGVTRSFGRVTALDAVDLTVRAGSFVVLLGPSGSGKSTLLRALAGIDRVDGGTVELAGRMVDGGGHHVPPERRDLAMVFQDYALWPHLDVEHNVAFALRRRRLDATAQRRAVLDMLDRVGLADKAARYPDELSGGQQQRVALARALVGSPRLVLFDEPLSNLDADLRERLRVQIATLTAEAGASAVYITHDQTEAFALADDLLVLDGGRVVQRGAPEHIYHRPASPFVARFTGLAGALTGRVSAVEGDTARVEAVGGTLLVHGPGLAPGTEVEVLIRPSAVRFADDTTPGNRVDGVVVDRAYRGIGYDHVVETPLGVLSGVRHAEPSARGERRSVVITTEGCFAYPVTPQL